MGKERKKRHIKWLVAILGLIMIVLAGWVFLIGVGSVRDVELVSPASDTQVTVANNNVVSLMENYSVGAGLDYYGQGEICTPSPVKLKWKSHKVPEGTKFHIVVAKDEALSEGQLSFVTWRHSLALRTLAAGETYFWRVQCQVKGETYTSETYSFRTKDYPRFVRVKGISNFRDIGGWVTTSGHRVAQGKVYRSANLDKVKSAGIKTWTEDLQIKTDLDLRRPGEGTAGTESPMGDDVNYVNISAPKYEELWEDADAAENREAFVREMRVFSDSSNYPINLHCQYGRDRTGTLVFMLQALLGVEEEDLYREYELSFLSKMGTKSKKGGEYWLDRYTNLLDYMKSYESPTYTIEDKDSLAEHVEVFLLDNGMTREEIQSIRELMLE